MNEKTMIGIGLIVMMVLVIGGFYYLSIANTDTHSISVSSYVQQIGNSTVYVKTNYTLAYINGTVIGEGKTQVNQSIIFSGLKVGTAADLKIGGAYTTGGIPILNGTSSVQNIFIPITKNSSTVIQEAICLNCG